MLFQGIDVGQIACQSVKVESVAKDELAGDFKSHIVRSFTDGEGFGLEKQRDHLDRSRIMFGQFLAELCCRDTAVDDVLHDEYVAALDVLGQSHELFYLTGGLHALVRLETDKRYLGIMQIACAEQVRSKDERSIKDTQEQGVLALIVALDFPGQAVNLLGYLFSSDVGLKCQPLISDLFQLFTELKRKDTIKFLLVGFSTFSFFMEQ